VAKAEENLFLQSQFAGTWAFFNSSLTANASIAPDGTNSAASIVPNATSSAHGVVQTAGVVGSTYTYSVFAKANGYTNIQFYADSSGNFTATFDLTAVTAAFSGSATAATITSVGNGWYRCSATFTMAASNRLNLQGFPTGATASNFGNTFAGNGVSGVFVWGAQLEQRSSVTAYTPTTTQPITSYIPALQTALAGVPRFDHNPLTGESLGLEIEEQRVNLLTYSEQFDNAAWTKSAISITANTVVAPDGTLTADVLIEDTSTGSHQLTRSSNLSFSSGTAYTLTFFAKQNGRSRINIAADVGASTFPAAANAIYDLSTGTIVSTGASATASIVSAGNGWYRCSLTATATATAGSRPGYYIQLTSSGNVSYTGDGFSGIYLWGAQLEAGAFATSYIPTVASQVTRSADAASMTGTNFSSWYRQDEGTLYGEGTTISPSWQNALFIDCTAGGMDFNGNSVNVGYSRGVGSSRSAVSVNGVAQCDIPIANTNAIRKVALGAAVNNFNAASNGVLGAQDSSGLMPTVNQALIGAANYGLYLNGTIRRLAYYPKRLTNAQLQAITS
jgi:hypothetical protein